MATKTTTAAKKFNSAEHLIKVKGKDYLPVAWRLVWFREAHPDGSIETIVLPSDVMYLVRAIVRSGVGEVIATAHGTAPFKAPNIGGKPAVWTGRELEKAETAAMGRALAVAGFGTQWTASELDDSEHLADSPIGDDEESPAPPAPSQRRALPKRAAPKKEPRPAYDLDTLGSKLGEWLDHVTANGKYVNEGKIPAKNGKAIDAAVEKIATALGFKGRGEAAAWRKEFLAVYWGEESGEAFTPALEAVFGIWAANEDAAYTELNAFIEETLESTELE